eukprot:136764-Pyramimonas_sp.AAC.1
MGKTGGREEGKGREGPRRTRQNCRRRWQRAGHSPQASRSASASHARPRRKVSDRGPTVIYS